MKTITSKEKNLRVLPGVFLIPVSGQDKRYFSQISQVIVSDCHLYIPENPMLGPSDSAAQVGKQLAGATEFFLFESKLSIIKIREY